MAKRMVAPVPGFESEILDQIRTLPLACATGVGFLIEELETEDPDLDERCGLLADRREVFAVRVPDCAQRRLIVSIDRRADAVPCTLHGVIARGQQQCETGRRLAVRQFGLVDPAWEPGQ